MDRITRRIDLKTEPSLPRRLAYDGPLQVVLVGVGPKATAVAEIVRSAMNLTLTDPEALYEAVPLVLYEALEHETAVAFIQRLKLAGAFVEQRMPPERYQGIRRKISPLSRNAA